MSEPMRTDTGPGALLRERLIEALVLADGSTWEDLRDMYGRQVDAILVEIVDAGFILEPREQRERVNRVVVNARAFCFGLGTYGDLISALRALQPSDLEPIEGVGS